MKRLIPLEREAEVVANESTKCPLIFQLPPSKGRTLFDEMQNTPVCTYPTTTTVIPIDTCDWGIVNLYCVTPCNTMDCYHVIYYIHGGGWVFGNFHTHYKLVTELAARTNSMILFPEYSLSPEAKYPTALEQCYALLCYLPELIEQMDWNVTLDTLTVAGDSVGGNMATVMTLLSKYRNGPCIHKQLLYYPVTNACFHTRTYRQFATDYYLYRMGMMWFWNQYTCNLAERNEITASPLRASLEQLCGLPDTMILNGEADVLREEGESYARKLRMAGVDVTALRFQATIHDFVMLNALDQSNATRAAMDSSVEWINRKNSENQLS